MTKARIIGKVDLFRSSKKMSPKKQQKIEKKVAREHLAKRQMRETSLRLFREEKYGEYKKLTRAEKRQSRIDFVST